MRRNVRRGHVIASLIATLIMTLSVNLAACRQEAAHDPVWMYFLESETKPGDVYLVIEPNDAIPAWAEITIRNESLWIWVGGEIENDGSFISQPFVGATGDHVRITTHANGQSHLDACVLVGNFGSQPEPCD